MAQVTINPDGSADFPVHLTAEQVQILLYKHYAIDAGIFDAVEEASVGIAYQELQSKAQAFYKAEFEEGREDGSLSALGREADLVAWYMSHPETETVKQEQDRLAQEEADRIAAEEAAEAKRLADLEAAQAEAAAAEEALSS
jgi:hypothetical protein